MFRSPERNRRTPVRGWRAAVVALVLAVCSTLLVGGVATAADDYTQIGHVAQRDAGSDLLHPDDRRRSTSMCTTSSPGRASRTSGWTSAAGPGARPSAGCPPAASIDYWFTYEKSGPQYDTPHFSYTHGGSTTPVVATPTFSPGGGSYSTAQTVTISTATAGSTIRYTVDGSTPTASSTLYSGPISVPVDAGRSTRSASSPASTNSAVRARRTRSARTPTSCPTQPDVPNFGPNTRIFDPSMSAATIQAQLDADFNAQKDTLDARRWRTGRVAHLFKPGTYSVHDDVGYYTSVAGLGQNPGDVRHQRRHHRRRVQRVRPGRRAAELLAVRGEPGRQPDRRHQPLGRLAGRAVPPDGHPRQPAALPGQLRLRQRRLHRRHARCPARPRPSRSSSGTPATATSAAGPAASGTWSSPVRRAPRRPRSRTRRRPRSPPRRSRATCRTCTSTAPASTACSCPSLRTNASGASWANGTTPGTSIPMSQFYVVKAGRHRVDHQRGAGVRAATCSSRPASTTSTRRST